MFHIRHHSGADLVSLAQLIEEMQAHYNVSCPPRTKLLNALSDLPNGVEFLIAESTAAPGTLFGFAAYSAIFPGPEIGKGLFVKELFVTKAARGQGIGRSLLKAIAGIALSRGCSRLDWTADRNNQRLVDFYKSLGAQPQEEKVFFRLSGDALRQFQPPTLEC